jgi:hypothetical protein
VARVGAIPFKILCIGCQQAQNNHLKSYIGDNQGNHRAGSSACCAADVAAGIHALGAAARLVRSHPVRGAPMSPSGALEKLGKAAWDAGKEAAGVAPAGPAELSDPDPPARLIAATLDRETFIRADAGANA